VAGLVVIVVGSLPVAVGDPLDPYSIGAGGYLEMTPDGPLEIRPIVLAARRRVAAAHIDGTVEWADRGSGSEIIRTAMSRELPRSSSARITTRRSPGCWAPTLRQQSSATRIATSSSRNDRAVPTKTARPPRHHFLAPCNRAWV